METEDLLMIGAVAAAGYFVYKATQPISDTLGGIGGGISEIAGSTGSAYGEVVDVLGETIADNISLLNLKHDAIAVVDAAKSILDRAKSSSAPLQIKENPKLSISRSNTIYTKGSKVAGPVKTVDTTRASSMIGVYQDPKIKNIASTLGSGTIYTQKSVSLPPSLLSQIII